MNSLEIQYFLTIVKYGSFTEAAQALSVSQPAISKQIRQLEAELGCSLFARSGRTLSLTEAGRAYHAYFQQCRFQLNLLKNKLEEQKKDGKLILRIAYPEDVDPSYFRDRIQAAAAAMEKPVRLEFSCYPEAELPGMLLDGQIDLILAETHPGADFLQFFSSPTPRDMLQHAGSQTTLGKFQQPDSQIKSALSLSIQFFSEIPQVLLCTASRPEAANISEFRNDTFLFSESDAALQSHENLYALFQDLGFAPKIRFAANLSTILDLTAQNEGVYLTHAWCRACKNPEYRTLMLPSTRRFYLICSETIQKSETSQLLHHLAKNS